MKRGLMGAALIAAVVASSAAFAAPKNKSSGDDGVETGTLFNCVIPMPGPRGYRIGACWLAE